VTTGLEGPPPHAFVRWADTGKTERLTNARYRQNYGFTGLADTLLQRGQQLSGALGIPLVRLSGQSPVGLSATGESDICKYNDSIRSQQETRLRRTEAGAGQAEA